MGISSHNTQRGSKDPTTFNDTILAVKTNKNIIMSSFKTSGDIQKKEGGPDRCFG